MARADGDARGHEARHAAGRRFCDAEQTFRFCTVRDGWVFIAAQDAAADSLEITLDGKLTVITAKTPRLETFRDILKGDHTISIKGAANGGQLVIRSIPEIYNYKPCCNSMVSENPPYDWDFQNKYVHYAVTTHNDGVVPEEHQKEFFDAGYKWIDSIGTVYVSADTHKPLLLNACVVMSFLTTGCTAIEETVRGSVIIAKEKMGMQTATAAPAPAPRAAQSTEAMLDAEIESQKFTNVWRGMDELVTDYEDVLA